MNANTVEEGQTIIFERPLLMVMSKLKSQSYGVEAPVIRINVTD